jgi:hypothetical protein
MNKAGRSWVLVNEVGLLSFVHEVYPLKIADVPFLSVGKISIAGGLKIDCAGQTLRFPEQ